MGQMKKIAIVSNFPAWLVNDAVPERKGHYPVWLVPLYHAFESCPQYEIHWVTLSRNISEPIRFVSKNQHFHVLPCGSRTIGLYTFYLADRIRIYRELSRISPHIVHTWGTENCYGLCGNDFKKRAVWLHSVQGILNACIKYGETPRFQRLLARLEPGVLRNAPFITTESPWAAEEVRLVAPRANPIIWDYAVESRFFNEGRKLCETPTCLYCGSFTKLKNLDTLINVFSRAELSHIKLIMAGPEPTQFSELPPNVEALGRVSRDKVVELMSQSWCLVHPSLVDTGPTVAKEARVVGLPVVISSHCGAQQYVKDGLSGFITAPMDEDAIASAILKIAASKDEALSMGEFDHGHCRQSLSSETMCSRLIQIYQKLLGTV